MFNRKEPMDNVSVSEPTIEISVNGEPYQINPATKVLELVQNLNFAPERLAIELNRAILPRGQWAETDLQPGDKLEIVHFVGGG